MNSPASAKEIVESPRGLGMDLTGAERTEQSEELALTLTKDLFLKALELDIVAYPVIPSIQEVEAGGLP